MSKFWEKLKLWFLKNKENNEENNKDNNNATEDKTDIGEIIKEVLKSPLKPDGTCQSIERCEKFFKKFIKSLDKVNLDEEYKLFGEIQRRFSRFKNEQQKPWLRNKCTISFLGRFSSGKSSIINSLLGKQLLPVGVTPVTAVPTYISIHPLEEPKIRAIDKDDQAREISLDIFKKITKDKFRDFPLSKIFKCFVIECYNENLLKSNLSILDTPGYDSLDESDRQAVMRVIEETHYIFWVIDINDGTISADALKFLKNIIDYQSANSIYVVINKADLKSPKDRQKVKDEVEKFLQKEGINYKECFLYSVKSDEYKSEFYKIIQNIYHANDSENEDFKKYVFNLINGKILRHIVDKQKGLEILKTDKEILSKYVDSEVRKLTELHKEFIEMREELLYEEGLL